MATVASSGTAAAAAAAIPAAAAAAATPTTPSVTTRFYLVRHGETPWNEAGIMQGIEDVPLNGRGWAQAAAAGEYMRTTYLPEAGPPWLVVSSDLCRAADTARVIAAAMGLPAYTLPGLRETGMGHWQGHTWDEVLASFPAEAAKWRAHHDFAMAGAGGESFRGRFARVARAMHELLALHAGKRIILVSHGGALDDVLRLVLPVGFGEPTGLHKVNAGIGIVECVHAPPATAFTPDLHDFRLPAEGGPHTLSPSAAALVPDEAAAAHATPPFPVAPLTPLPRCRAVLDAIDAWLDPASVVPRAATRVAGAWRVVQWGITAHLRLLGHGGSSSLPSTWPAGSAATAAAAAAAAAAPAPPAVAAEGDIQPTGPAAGGMVPVDAAESDDEEAVESGIEPPGHSTAAAAVTDSGASSA